MEGALAEERQASAMRWRAQSICWTLIKHRTSLSLEKRRLIYLILTNYGRANRCFHEI